MTLGKLHSPNSPGILDPMHAHEAHDSLCKTVYGTMVEYIDKGDIKHFVDTLPGFVRVQFGQTNVRVVFMAPAQAAYALQQIQAHFPAITCSFARKEPEAKHIDELGKPSNVLWTSSLYWTQRELLKYLQTFNGFDRMVFESAHSWVYFTDVASATRALEELNATTNLYTVYSKRLSVNAEESHSRRDEFTATARLPNFNEPLLVLQVIAVDNVAISLQQRIHLFVQTINDYRDHKFKIETGARFGTLFIQFATQASARHWFANANFRNIMSAQTVWRFADADEIDGLFDWNAHATFPLRNTRPYHRHTSNDTSFIDLASLEIKAPNDRENTVLESITAYEWNNAGLGNSPHTRESINNLFAPSNVTVPGASRSNAFSPTRNHRPASVASNDGATPSSLFHTPPLSPSQQLFTSPIGSYKNRDNTRASSSVAQWFEYGANAQPPPPAPSNKPAFERLQTIELKLRVALDMDIHIPNHRDVNELLTNIEGLADRLAKRKSYTGHQAF